MDAATVLAELASDVLPHWIERLRSYIPPESSAVITPTMVTTTPQAKKDGPVVLAPQQEEVQKTPSVCSPGPLNDLKAFIPLTQTHGMSKLDSKPDASKSRFSAISGPTIYYDGESQAMLNNLWTVINSKRGLLRREVMNVKRRQQFAAIAAQMSSDESSDEDEDKEDKDEEDDNAELLRMKMKLQRDKMLQIARRANPLAEFAPGQKRKAMSALVPQSNAEDDSKLQSLLEAIDDNLDKATKVCETAAFIWLKGDLVTSHLKFMIGRFRDSINKIEQSGLIRPKADEKGREQTPEEEAQRKEEASTPMPPISKAVAEGKEVEMKDDSVIEVASSCAADEDAEASSIDTVDNPKMIAAKRRMKETAAKLEARQQLHASSRRNEWSLPPQVGVVS